VDYASWIASSRQRLAAWGREVRDRIRSAPAAARRDAPTVLKHAGAWLVILGIGALLLRGRYDFGAPNTKNSYASALFFFVPTIVALHYVLRLSPLRRRVVHGLTAAAFVLFTLPHHWLGLDKLRADPKAQWWSDVGTDPQLQFLPAHFPAESFPHERLFFLGLLLVFAATAALVVARGLAASSSLREGLRRARAWIGAYAAVLLVSFLHTGLRGGYTLNAFFAVAANKRNWYILYLFPATRQGAVSADFPYFWDIDRYFQGVPAVPRTLVLRRPFLHYVASHVSAFVNPWYVYLVLNTLLWLAAAACVYALVRRVTGRQPLAVFAAALVCVGNGFHYFVSQPKSYLAGYALVAVMLYTFDVLLASDRPWPWMRALLCGLALGLMACTYDAQPILLGLLVYAVFRRLNLLRALAVLAIAFVIPALWVRLQFNVLGLPLDRANSYIAEDTMHNVAALVTDPKRGLIYSLVVHAFTVFAQNMAYDFMVAALVAAVLGFVLADAARDRWLGLILFVPAMVLDLVLVLGQVKWAIWYVAELPRLSYIAYPAVYLGVALVLERVLGGGARWRVAAAWALVAALGFWQSADIFGFLSPSIHFYFPEQSPWLDAI
jgi:hypothetical protein